MTTMLAAIVHHNPDLLEEREAASFLTIPRGTLAVWRSTGRYNIPFIKIGRSVRYSRKALQAWLDSRTRHATA
jgi:excisionase family DNA binding protein